MARSPNQKLKLLYLMRVFLEKTDEKHPITVAELIAELARYDISAERKSIYDDIEALRLFGLDIIQVKAKTTGYYVGSRDFELPELKLLVDSVQSSKFITQSKTLALIRKIEGLASVHEARELQRQVYVRNRVKSMNESVYYNVDDISDAISRDRAIRFRYYEYTVTKERRYRRDGALYETSPYALLWDDENYYMLAWDAKEARMKHFRVDKMSGIRVLETPREGESAFQSMDMSSYTQHVFGMFAGQTQPVKLRFANHLVGAVIDRFGKDVILAPDGDEHFTLSLDVVISPQFYGWVYGFGTEAEILYPESVRQEMRQIALETAKLYQ
ncbi:MAG: helix-turn-helix transcriptional regulator [Oscillospiraceae bacterium]